MTTPPNWWTTTWRSAVLLVMLLLWAAVGRAQEPRLTVQEQTVPVRLSVTAPAFVSTKRVTEGRGVGSTDQWVVDTLRRFRTEIPPKVNRMKEMAAVLVTAEVVPNLRAGARSKCTERRLPLRGDA
jgi:flagellar P-ring protein FlgI